jgi:4-carboxymuconolactone decarboxylase
VRVAGEVWGNPLVLQMKKAFLAIVLDVSHESYSGPGITFEAHFLMAMKKELASQKSKRCLH